MVATLLGLLIAVPAAVLTTATPAMADGPCCQVAITNMPGEFRAGAGAKPFTLRVVDQSGQGLRTINVAFTLQANGVNASQVHVSRQRIIGGFRSLSARNHGNQIIVNDSVDVQALGFQGQGGNIQYNLAFGQNVPSGGLSISVQVDTRKDAPATAGPYSSMIVGYGQANPVPSQTATTPTDSPSDATTDGATDAAAPGDQNSPLGGQSSDSSGGGSLMWIAYTLGALLLLGGVGVIGTMLYRRGPRNAEAEWGEDEQAAYPQDGGYAPTQVANYGPPTQVESFTAPTQVGGYGDAYGTPTQVAGYGTPTQAAGYSAPTQAMPAQIAPTQIRPPTGRSGRHSSPPSAPTSQYPAPQDPYADADQTWADPRR